MTSLYDFSFTSIDGEPLPMTGFRDRAVLVRKFTSIGVQNMDARVDQSQMRIDI